MNKQQSGFTILEVLIAVTIVGILAAIAIPAYQDYTIRTQVSEGMDLMSEPKVAVGEFFDNNGGFPANNASAGLPAAGSIQGKYVSKVDISTASGQIQATFGAGAHPVIQNDILILSATPNAGAVEWTCYSNNIDSKYLPRDCQ